MPLSAGTRLGPYEIQAPIGEGGMGEVYRGLDTRLGRTVAIKVVKGEFSERFEREARAVAALNHPNICALYDVGDNFLAMEYVEGKPLEGPLPVEKAIEYAKQILDALSTAHRKGIVHRDLKPANILVAKSGVKLLDFGLAKMDRTGSAPLGDETLTQAISQQGTIAGTLQYMPPEQLQGKETDARSDIFAFGCVLFEILTGKRAFDGDNAASVITAVMSGNPPSASSVSGMVPPALDRVIRQCLAKDPDDRWQSAHDLKTALEWTVVAPPQTASTPAPPGRRNYWPVAAALCLVLGAGGAWLAMRRASPVDPPVLRFEVLPPANATLIDVPSISPDGKSLAFVASTPETGNMIYVRSLENGGTRTVARTEGALYSFWSPDSRSLGFTTRNGFKRIDLAGGAARVLSTMPHGSQNGTWNQFGDILFYPTGTGGIARISESGGAVTNVTESETGAGGHRFPQFLPDGKRFLFFIFGGAGRGNSTVELGGLGSFDHKTILRETSAAIYARGAHRDGYLLYSRDDTLMAQRFDESAGVLQGEASAIAYDVGRAGQGGTLPNASVSATGILVYHAGTRRSTGRLVWHDRQGKIAGELLPAAAGASPALSPDGRMLAASRWDPGTGDTDVWVTDLERNVTTRLTFGPGSSGSPVWSIDGKRVAYRRLHAGKYDVREKYVTGGGEEKILDLPGVSPFGWSSNGKYFLGGFRLELSLVPLDGDRKPAVVATNSFRGSFSPDGSMIAYSSGESGRPQIHVIAAPPASGKWQITSDGGYQPSWRRDGKELFYIDPEGNLMAVDVASAPAFRPGVPKKLFRTGVDALAYLGDISYVVSADGSKFLVHVPGATASAPAINVVMNWSSLVKK